MLGFPVVSVWNQCCLVTYGFGMFRCGAARCVGWAKRPGANASGGVPTESARRRSIQKMVGTAQMRLCPPYASLPTLAFDFWVPLAYSGPVPAQLITVAETPLFQRQAKDVWDENEREDFVNFIARNP